MDSGAAGNFIDQALASSLNMTSYPLSSPFPVQALDNRLLWLPSRLTSRRFTRISVRFSSRLAPPAPPHCPWDCAIHLLTDSAPPRSHIYPLSVFETKATRSTSRRLVNRVSSAHPPPLLRLVSFLWPRRSGVFVRELTREVSMPSPPSTATPSRLCRPPLNSSAGHSCLPIWTCGVHTI